MKKFLILIVFSIFMFKTSYAADACSYATKGGVYDGILDSFVTTAKTWNTTLLPLVTRIFWGVFAAEFLYQLTFKKILSNDLSKLYVFFVIRMFTAYIFAYVFLNLDTYMGIINFFTRIGAELGGQTMSASEGSSGMGISPSGIMSYLECEFATLNALFLGGALLGQWIGLGTFFSEALLGVVVGMNLIAVIVTVTMLDAYVVIFGGFILVGFSGSSWTQSYWQKYLSYAVATGIRLFMTCLILGLVFKGFDNLNTAASTPTEAITSIFKLLGYLILSVYLLFTVPSKAASMLTGSMGGGMGELVGAASMLMAGGSMAKLAGGSAKSQASALMEKLGGPGKNPSPSTLKSNTTTATQSAKSETAKSGKVEAMGKSMGQGEQPTPKPKFNDSLPDSGSTPAPTSSAGSPSSSSSGSTPAPTSSGGSPSSSSSGSTPAPTSSTGNPSSSSNGSTPAPTSSGGSPSSSSSGSTPAPSSSAGSPSSSSSGSTPAPSSSAGSPSSSSSGSTPAPSSSAGSPSSSSSGSTPAPSSSAGSPSSSSSVSTPAPSGSGGSPSSSSSGSTPAPSSSGGNSGSISNGKGSTTPQPSTKATLAKHGKSFADSVNKVSSGHAGAADININPHKE